MGIASKKDDPLGARKNIKPSDLSGLRLMCSSQHSVSDEIGGWLGDRATTLDIVATYVPLYNAAIMVQEGVGAAVCLDGIVDISSSSSLRFRPFDPAIELSMAIAWKKGNSFSAASSIFREALYDEATKYKSAMTTKI